MIEALIGTYGRFPGDGVTLRESGQCGLNEMISSSHPPGFPERSACLLLIRSLSSFLFPPPGLRVCHDFCWNPPPSPLTSLGVIDDRKFRAPGIGDPAARCQRPEDFLQ